MGFEKAFSKASSRDARFLGTSHVAFAVPVTLSSEGFLFCFCFSLISYVFQSSYFGRFKIDCENLYNARQST